MSAVGPGEQPEAAPDTTSGLLLVVRIEAAAYAVPAFAVERILPMAAITPLPPGAAPASGGGAAGTVVGALNVHGAVLPVVDPRPALSGRRPEPPEPPGPGHPGQRLLLIAAPVRYLLWVDDAERTVWPDAAATAAGAGPLRMVPLDGALLPVLRPETFAPDAGAARPGGRVW
jgi:chemotaxis signal transduction protein